MKRKATVQVLTSEGIHEFFALSSKFNALFVFCKEKKSTFALFCLVFTENLFKLKLENAHVSEWLNFLSVFLAEINFME